MAIRLLGKPFRDERRHPFGRRTELTFEPVIFCQPFALQDGRNFIGSFQRLLIYEQFLNALGHASTTGRTVPGEELTESRFYMDDGGPTKHSCRDDRKTTIRWS